MLFILAYQHQYHACVLLGRLGETKARPDNNFHSRPFSGVFRTLLWWERRGTGTVPSVSHSSISIMLVSSQEFSVVSAFVGSALAPRLVPRVPRLPPVLVIPKRTEPTRTEQKLQAESHPRLPASAVLAFVPSFYPVGLTWREHAKAPQ